MQQEPHDLCSTHLLASRKAQACHGSHDSSRGLQGPIAAHTIAWTVAPSSSVLATKGQPGLPKGTAETRRIQHSHRVPNGRRLEVSLALLERNATHVRVVRFSISGGHPATALTPRTIKIILRMQGVTNDSYCG